MLYQGGADADAKHNEDDNEVKVVMAGAIFAGVRIMV